MRDGAEAAETDGGRGGGGGAENSGTLVLKDCSVTSIWTD